MPNHLDSKLHQIQAYLAEARSKNVEIPAEQMDAIEMFMAQHRLEEICHGRGLEQDVVLLVKYHWPEVLLDDWQSRLIWQILSGRHTDLNEVAIKGCTKAGKGFSVAIAACLWFQSAEECKVIITSQRHKHAHDVMFGEVLRNRKRMIGQCKGNNGDTRIKANEQKYIITASPESGEGFSGQHGPATLFIFDESTSVPESYWDLGKTQAACMVALANPRTMSGWFRRIFPISSPDDSQVIDIPGGRRYLATVGGNDCLNVKTGKPLIREQITRERYLAIKAHPNPRWGRIFGDGQFPDEDEDVLVIAPSWLDRHLKAWRSDIHITAFGLDVAASEQGDRTELAVGGASGCAAVHEYRDVDTMRVVAWTLKTAEDKHGIKLTDGGSPVVVDMDGLGKGVGDRLAELGVNVIEFRGNATSQEDPKQYVNLRTEAYAELGRRLDPRGAWPDDAWGIPHDSELCDDLCAPEKIFQSDGVKFGLTPKSKPSPSYKGDTLKERLGRSPDKGDSVVYLYHGVRDHMRGMDWQERFEGDFLASGESPHEEHRRFNDEEIAELPEFLKELVTSARQCRVDRNDFDDDEGF